MEEILLGVAGLVGLTALLQSKSSLPSEADYNKALAKLKDTPADEEANGVVGKYQVFVLGNFKDGLPFLARSSDATLKALADHELAPLYADTPAKKVGMGDEWVAAAKNFKPLYRFFYDRASQWYAQAYPDLEGVWRDKTRERMTKLLASPVTGGAVKKGLSAGWSSTHPAQKASLDSTVSHNGVRSVRLEMQRDGGLPFWLQGPSMAAPKGKVQVVAYIATDGTTSPNDKLMLNFYNQAGGNVLYYETKFLPDAPYWQRVVIDAEVPKTAVKYSIAVMCYSTSGFIWVDDISMKSEGKEIVENGSFEK